MPVETNLKAQSNSNNSVDYTEDIIVNKNIKILDNWYIVKSVINSRDKFVAKLVINTEDN